MFSNRSGLNDGIAVSLIRNGLLIAGPRLQYFSEIII